MFLSDNIRVVWKKLRKLEKNKEKLVSAYRNQSIYAVQQPNMNASFLYQKFYQKPVSDNNCIFLLHEKKKCNRENSKLAT